MKKIIIIFILALTATFSFGQTTWTVPQNLGGTKTLVTVPGGLKVPNGVVLGSFEDTLTANNSSIKLYEGAYIDVAGVLHRRKNNKWIVANLAARDTLYILASGQSNSAGGAEDAIDTTSDARIQGWDSQINQWVQYRVGFRPSYTLYPSQGGSGYPIGPSAQFFFARKLAREKDVIVRVVNWGIGGQPISQWHNGTARGPYMDIIANMTTAAAVPKYDYFIWDQGEANSASTSLYYKTAWDSVKTSFRRYSWFPATTKIAVVGMPRQYNGAPTGYQGIDPTLQSFDGNEDPYDGYANTDSATVNAVGAADGGVRIHFNSKGLKHLGEQTIWATFESLPSRYGDPGQSERFDLITPGRIYIGHGGSNTIKDANGIFNNGWESNTVVTPTYAENARWEASSMTKNTTGSYNTAMGRESMNKNESGYWNSAYGAQSLNANVSGFRNSAFGLQSLFKLASGNDNTTLGYRAGSDLQSGSYNVILGSSAATRLNGRSRWMLFADGTGTERFTVDSVGNMGIGVTDPTQRLDVLGNIKFTGLAFENSDTLSTKAYARAQGLYTASNGNTKVGNDIQIGGTLDRNTLIGTSTFNLTLQGNAIPLTSNALGNTSALSLSNDGASTKTLSASNNSTGGAALLQSSGPNTLYIGSLTGTPGIDFQGSSSLYNQPMGNYIPSWIDNTDATRTSRVSIYGIDNTVPKRFLDIQPGGIIRTNDDADTLATRAYARAQGGSGGSTLTMDAIGSTPNANGATITGSVLRLQPASGSLGGVLTAGTQTIGGDKTFNGFLTTPSFFFGYDGGRGIIATNDLSQSMNLRKYVKVLGDNGAYGNVDASASFQIDGTNRGFLQPRLTTAQVIAIPTPATGLSVYDSTLNVPKYFNGSAWVENLTNGTQTIAGNKTFTGNLYTSDIISSFNVGVGGSSSFYWSGKSGISSPTDGVIRLSNSGTTDFNRLQLGGTTSAFPSIARSGANIYIKDAAGGDLSGLIVGNLKTGLTAPTTTGTTKMAIVDANGQFSFKDEPTSSSSSSLSYSTFNADSGLNQVRSSLANYNNQVIPIVFYGNSITAGVGATSNVGYAQLLETYLKGNYGTANNESLSKLNDDARFIKTVGAWIDFGLGGIAGRAYGETGNTKLLTINNLVGTGIEVFYVRNTFTTAPFEYSVDGGAYISQAQTASASSATAKVLKLSITGLAQGTHNIVIKAPATDYVFITGVSSTVNTTGVKTYNYGYSGAQVNEFYNTSDNRADALTAMNPALTVISLTSNDYAGQRPIVDYKTAIQAMITSAKSVKSSVLLVSDQWRAGVTESGGITQRMYSNALKELAVLNNVAFLDVLDLNRSVTFQGVDTLNLTTDGIHPNNKGHNYLFQAVNKSLSVVPISVGGTVDATLTDGSTNAIQNNAVFDGLALKSNINIDSSRLVNSNLHATIAQAIKDTMDKNPVIAGYGLAKPDSILRVDTLTITSRAKAQNDSLALVAAINAGSGSSKWTDAGANIYRLSSVGIGTDDPGDLLHVKGSDGAIKFGGSNGRKMAVVNAANNALSFFDIEAITTVFNSDAQLQNNKRLIINDALDSKTTIIKYDNDSLGLDFKMNDTSAFFLAKDGGKAKFRNTVKIGAYTLPATDGTANQALTTNGAGTVTWQTPAGGTTGTNLTLSGNLRVNGDTGIIVQQGNFVSEASDVFIKTNSGANTVFRGIRASSFWNDAESAQWFQVGNTEDNVAFTAQSGSPMERMGILAKRVQIGENTGVAPIPSAMLSVTSTNRGFLAPRMTKVQRNAIFEPAAGLMVIVIGEVGGEYLSWYNSSTTAWVKVSSVAD